MALKRLKATLANVLNIPVDDIVDETSPDNVSTWDSMTAMILVNALEKEFNVKFSAGDIVGVKNVGDVKKSLSRHGIDFNEN